MTEIQSQPPIPAESEVGSQVADKDALVVRLDELLETYLHTLDKYQKTREQLSKQLSSGYLNLAQANFQNRSGMHYGQDNYDERMQAMRKVSVIRTDHAAATEDKVGFSIVSDQSSTPSIESTKSEAPKEESVETEVPPESTEKSKQASRSVDPLRWFGILVPPALRAAQSDFVGAVEGPVARLASVARDLRSQEIEIGRVRKQIKKL